MGLSQRRKRKPAKKKALNFEDLQIGDYVVHEAHGVGKYVGTRRLEVSGIQKDYILIEYGGEDKLFLPIEALIPFTSTSKRARSHRRSTS